MLLTDASQHAGVRNSCTDAARADDSDFGGTRGFHHVQPNTTTAARSGLTLLDGCVDRRTGKAQKVFGPGGQDFLAEPRGYPEWDPRFAAQDEFSSRDEEDTLLAHFNLAPRHQQRRVEGAKKRNHGHVKTALVGAEIKAVAVACSPAHAPAAPPPALLRQLPLEAELFRQPMPARYPADATTGPGSLSGRHMRQPGLRTAMDVS